MKHMLIIYGNTEGWDALTEDDIRARDEAHGAVFRELRDTGELIDGGELSPEGSRVVRRGSVVDGPFTEGRELVGGYYIIDVVDVDRAVEIANRLKEIDTSVVDVRRFVEH